MNISTEHAIPDLSHARRILCVQPHYDDNDIGAGGTIATLSDAGAEIFYLTVTDDLVGVVDMSLADEEATRRLKGEQVKAGQILGVSWQSWLGYPDAGKYDYYEMRNHIIRYIRLIRPDFLFTCDPWLPYEAHRDHTLTGHAVSEAAGLHSMLRLKTDPEADRGYEPYEISGVVFYFTNVPNATVDISENLARKHQALACYQTQFTEQSLAELQQQIEMLERGFAQGKGFEFGEPLKVLNPGQLHVSIMTQNA